MDLISLILSKNASGGSATEKTVIFDGTPTKMDLTSAGLGYAYFCSADDLITAAKGQDIHFSVEFGGAKYSGVLPEVDYDKTLGVPYYWNKLPVQHEDVSYIPFLIYVPTLGGTGFQLQYGGGQDVGEITNLKLWTEYNENKVYYITCYSDGTNTMFFPVDQGKALASAIKMRLLIKYTDAGANTEYRTPTHVLTYSSGFDVALHVHEQDEMKHIAVENGQPRLG